MAFQKGQSGNPGGKPKGTISIVHLLLRKLKDKTPDGKKNADAVAEQLISLALSGDLDAIKVILDRVDGKVVERQEISGPDGGPVEYSNVDTTDEERAARITALLDRARARRDGSADSAIPDVGAVTGPADSGLPE